MPCFHDGGDVRVHQVDNALLPGPGEIQDSVDTVAGYVTTVVGSVTW